MQEDDPENLDDKKPDSLFIQEMESTSGEITINRPILSIKQVKPKPKKLTEDSIEVHIIVDGIISAEVQKMFKDGSFLRREGLEIKVFKPDPLTCHGAMDALIDELVSEIMKDKLSVGSHHDHLL